MTRTFILTTICLVIFVTAAVGQDSTNVNARTEQILSSIKDAPIAKLHDSLYSFIREKWNRFETDVKGDLTAYCDQSMYTTSISVLFTYMSRLFLTQCDNAAFAHCASVVLYEIGPERYDAGYCFLVASAGLDNAEIMLEQMRAAIAQFEGSACVDTARDWLKECREIHKKLKAIIYPE